jgi:hypothetical protein
VAFDLTDLTDVIDAKNIRIVLLLALALLVAPDGRAQNAGAFARFGMGARGISMSNALVADAGASAYYNPALAPYTEAQSLALSAGLLSFDRQLQFVQFATALEPSGGVTAGLIHAGVSEIDGRDPSGRHTRNYSTDEYAFFLNFGIQLFERFSVGAGLQVFQADYLEQLDPVRTIGVDLGMTARVTPELRLGFALDDLLARYSWDTSGAYGRAGTSTSDRFPRRLRLGASYERGRALVTAEYETRFTSRENRAGRTELVGGVSVERDDSERYTVQSNHFRVGTEVQLAEPLSVRAGAERLLRGSFGEIMPTAGFAVELPVGELQLHGSYAFRLNPYAVGTTHFLTMRVFL